MEYWTPKYPEPSLNAIGSGKAIALSNSTVSDTAPQRTPPAVSDKLLLEFLPWGHVELFNPNGRANPSAIYIEVEVKAIKRAHVSFETA